MAGAGRIVVTGRPGVGKSTLFSRIVESLRRRGCRVGGFSAPEVRESGRRVGFLLVDLSTGERAWLARVGAHCRGPRIGRYTVCADEAARLGVAALERAVGEADVIAVDEVGPMELALPPLRDAIVKALSTEKPLIAVIHAKLRTRDPEVYRLAVTGARVIELTLENRAFHSSRAEEYAAELAVGCGGAREE